ncbi:hypothetical protein O181_016299 [Austropuccinia psidii MF-1]|uniref:Uncharacterized protein n=1 Tax=Austropuccinia psidii MF-1 TaxID=1389203 RepID=A0A9Q3C3K9_9BASI|nr:hypothetical protein [Austropuccinia psidii MF-1]
MSYSEKKTLKQLPKASSWPKFCGKREYDHMELIDYIGGLFIDVPSIPDYCITARLNTAFKEHASIWHIEMKEIHGRRRWPFWKSQIIQKYRNGTCTWQKTMSFENDRYSVDKDPYEWRTEHAVKCRCNQNCTLDDITNTLQDVRKRTNRQKYSPYKSSVFKEKQTLRVEFKEKPRERVAEVAKKKNSCHNCGSTDHYANNFPKAKKKVYANEKVPEEEYPQRILNHTLWVMPSEKIMMMTKTKKRTPSGIPRGNNTGNSGNKVGSRHATGTANKNLCKHTQDAQTFLVTLTRGMAYIHGTATKMTVFIDNDQHPLIIDSGAHFSIVARNYLDYYFSNWEKQLFPTKAKNFKSASG